MCSAQSAHVVNSPVNSQMSEQDVIGIVILYQEQSQKPSPASHMPRKPTRYYYANLYSCEEGVCTKKPGAFFLRESKVDTSESIATPFPEIALPSLALPLLSLLSKKHMRPTHLRVIVRESAPPPHSLPIRGTR